MRGRTLWTTCNTLSTTVEERRSTLMRYVTYIFYLPLFSQCHRTAGHPPTKGSRILNLKARRRSPASATNRLIINSLTSAASILKPSSGVASAGLPTSTRTVKSPAMGFTRVPER